MSYLREHDEHTGSAGHASYYVVTIQGPLGNLFVQQCTECPLVKAFCLHAQCGWNTDCTVLTCYLCGEDCT